MSSEKYLFKVLQIGITFVSLHDLKHYFASKSKVWQSSMFIAFLDLSRVGLEMYENRNVTAYIIWSYNILSFCPAAVPCAIPENVFSKVAFDLKDCTPKA